MNTSTQGHESERVCMCVAETEQQRRGEPSVSLNILSTMPAVREGITAFYEKAAHNMAHFKRDRGQSSVFTLSDTVMRGVPQLIVAVSLSSRLLSSPKVLANISHCLGGWGEGGVGDTAI